MIVEHMGARLAVDVTGDGPAVLLLHAGIADRRMWDELVPPLAADYRVVRFDFQGFGDTVDGAGPVAHHEDAAAVLDALGIGPAVVVGASMGGAVALDLALTHASLVDALVLAGAALHGHDFTDEATFAGWNAASDAVESGEHQRAAEIEADMWVPGAAELVRRRVIEMLLATYSRPELDEDEVSDAASRLDEIAVPTLVVVGDRDRPDILRVADRLAAEIPSARLVRMPGLTHLPTMEAPEPFTVLLAEFLAASR